MNPRRRLLVVLGCVVCLLLIASFFPAADPRIEVSDGETSTSTAPSTQSTQTSPDQKNRTATPDNKSDKSLRPNIVGDPVPGWTSNASVGKTALGANGYTSVDLLVNGERIGTTEGDLVSFRVPKDARELNVTVEETGNSVTVPTKTNISVTAFGSRALRRDVVVSGLISGTGVSDATVFVDGEAVGQTNTDGRNTVTLPAEAGTTEIRVERGILSGTTTVDVQEAKIDINSPEFLLLPGMPARISVTSDGKNIENATVALSDGSETTTGGDGALVTVPVSDEVTVTATVGEEQTSTTISGLYTRATFVILVVPGLLIGVAVTYIRLVPKGRRGSLSGFSTATLSLAGLFGRLGITVTSILSRISASLSSFRLPRSGLPDLDSIRLGLSRLSLPSLSLSPLTLSGQRPPAVVSKLLDRGDKSDAESVDETRPDTEDRPTDEEPKPVPDNQTQLRRTWHRFLDQAGLTDRETQTPGEASRVAVAAGYPRRSVRRLLAIFRGVEYGDTEPSAEDISNARDELDTISQHDPEDDSE